MDDPEFWFFLFLIFAAVMAIAPIAIWSATARTMLAVKELNQKAEAQLAMLGLLVQVVSGKSNDGGTSGVLAGILSEKTWRCPHCAHELLARNLLEEDFKCTHCRKAVTVMSV